MKKKKRFKTEDLLGLYFSRAMSDDALGPFQLFQHLLGLQKQDEFILGHNVTNVQKLLLAQFDWLNGIDLSYYDEDVDSLFGRFHKLTESERKNKVKWLAQIKKTHGNYVMVRPLTDIEKAYLGYS